MRKGFANFPEAESVTHVFDAISATIPDQSIPLRQLLMQFAFIGNERLQEIVNRGFDGDEDENLLGVDVGALDYAEVHDRILELQTAASARAIHAESLEPESETEPETEPESQE